MNSRAGAFEDVNYVVFCDINHASSWSRNAGREWTVGFYTALGRRLIPAMANWQKGTKGSMRCNLLI